MKAQAWILLLAALSLGLLAAFPAKPPAPPKDLPPGTLGEMVKLGRELVEQTDAHPLSKPYVGNALKCSSCHLSAGTDPKAASFIGVATAYPAYSPREGTVITLQDRILNCFMRSMNGVRPPLGSPVAVAIEAYIAWLSQGLPLEMNPNAPLGPYSFRKQVQISVDPAKVSLERGKALYEARCAACHGVDGAGVATFPPVWGPRSFNAGAGLANVATLAAWLKVAMPLGNPNLSDQEAVDVAAYVNAHPRPDFVLREHLPPGQDLGVYNAKVTEEVVRAPTWPPKK